jgi:hypothetical protein
MWSVLLAECPPHYLRELSAVSLVSKAEVERAREESTAKSRSEEAARLEEASTLFRPMLTSAFRRCYWSGGAAADEYMTLSNCIYLLCVGQRELLVYTELVRAICEGGSRMLDMRLPFRDLMSATASSRMRACAK